MASATAVERFIELEVVFNGQSKNFQANVHAPLRPIFQRSMAEFGVRPAQPDEYGLFREGQSEPLELDRRIEELNLPEKAVLILQRRTPPRGG